MPRRLLVLALLLVPASVALADDLETSPSATSYLPVNEDVREEIQRIDRLIIRQKWREIVDICHKHITEPTRSVMKRDGTYVSARTVCEERLRKLPESVRRLYRTLYDPEAAKLYEAARSGRDLAAARRLVRNFSLTSYGPRGRLLLARLLFEHGDADAALAQWRRWLDTPAPETTPEADRRRIAVKVALAAARARDRAMLDRAVTLFGERGAAVDVGPHTLTRPGQLRELTDAAMPAAVAAEAPATLDVVRWRQRLRSGYTRRMSEYHGSSTRLLYSCIGDLRDGTLFVNAPDGLKAFDALTGQTRWERATRNYDSGYQAIRPFCFHARVDGDPGEPALVFISGGSRLAAHDAATGRLAWSKTRGGLGRLDAIGQDRNLRITFSSRVACRGGLAYVMLETFRGEVFAMALDRRTGEHRWLTLVGASAPQSGYKISFPAAVRPAGPDLLFCTGHGLIGACDAATGELRWLTPYRRRAVFARERYYGSSPGLSWSPLIVAGTTLVCAPSDGSQLIAVDRTTGRLVWEKVLDKPARPVGVLPPDDRTPQARIITVGTRVACRRVDNGAVAWTWPLPEPCDGLGRLTQHGLLVATEKGIYRIEPETGTLASFTRLPLGGADSLHVVSDCDSVGLIWRDGVTSVGDAKQTTALLAAGLKKDADDPWLHAARANVLRQQGQSAAALDGLVRAARLAGGRDAGLAGSLGEDLIEAYDARFHEDWDAGRRREAFNWLRSALHADPRTPYQCRIGRLSGEEDGAPHELRLASGDVLHGTLTALGGGRLTFVVGKDPWSIELAGVRSILLADQAGSPSPAAAAAEDEIGPAHGRITLRNRDRLSGEVVSLSDGKLELKAKFGVVALPTASVARIAFVRQTPRPKEKTVYLRLVSGDELSGVIRSFDGTVFELDIPHCGRRRIPADAVYTISNRRRMPPREPETGPSYDADTEELDP
jgi:outer membrane protein assembly factor BamB